MAEWLKPVRSLRTRLLLLTMVSGALALLVTGIALTTLFRQHVVSQFQAALERQLDQLTTELEFTGGAPRIDVPLSDPRLTQPYSGIYWQIDTLPESGPVRIGVLRSRSLWDANLVAGQDARPGELAVSEGRGPSAQQLLILQRIVVSDEAPGRSFRLMVAGDLRFNLAATDRFGRVLALALSLLLVLLGLAAWLQVSFGLRPLRNLQQALRAVHDGGRERLEGHFPSEIQGLVKDFNQVLQANAAVLERARTQAGNLAHALKTPLAVLEIEASRTGQDVDMVILREQLTQLRRHVDWHLSRARAAATTQSLPGQVTDVNATVADLIRVLNRVFDGKAIRVLACAPDLQFRGEKQDLQDMLGNLLENACLWAKSEVRLAAEIKDGVLHIAIEDDGPGVEADKLDAIRQRGVRLDESVPGTGLGLAIVQELAQGYGGELVLENTGSGFAATLILPGFQRR
jgi:signal transduction histidine kinase